MDPDLARIYRLSALQKERTRLTTMIEGCRGDNVQNKDGGETLTRSLERELANVDAELGGLEQEQFDYVRRARNQDSPAGPGGVLSRGQSMRSSVGFSSDVTLGGLVRGLGLGDWRGIKPEVRAMMSSGAAAAVPGYVTAGIVDAAREASVIFQAGAQVMAVDVPSAKVARVISEPGAEWLPESEERQLSDGAWVFDTGTLDACSAWLYTTLSVEAVEDCVDLDAAIQRSFAAQLALAFDQAALAGDGADMPLGIANMGTEDDRVIEVNDIGVLVDYRPFVRASCPSKCGPR
jgi:HK97 family phage major capsid protein